MKRHKKNHFADVGKTVFNQSIEYYFLSNQSYKSVSDKPIVLRLVLRCVGGMSLSFSLCVIVLQQFGHL